VLFAIAAVLCLGALAFTGRLHRGYVRTLEQSLRAGRVRLDPAEVSDDATQLTLAQTGLALDRDTLLREIEALRGRDESGAGDRLLLTITELRSGDHDRVRAVLRRRPENSAALVPHLVPLLAQDELFVEVLRALRRVAPAVTGQLLDALLDPGENPAVRRRLPRVLKVVATRRAVHGLLLGLEDARLDVRAQCALALASITSRHPELSPSRLDVFAAVRQELSVAASGLDLDHVFTLLSLTLEREPLHIALQAMRGSDRGLRGTALEYLENVLPEDLRGALWPYLGERGARPRPTRPREAVMNELLNSSAAVPLSRAALRARLPLGPPAAKS